jgi:hypothetical protein
MMTMLNTLRTNLAPFQGAWLLWVLVSAAPGCGGPRATSLNTYPVTGVVRYKSGDPLKGGSIQLQPTDGAPYSLRGDIQPQDGSFSLFSFLEGGKRKSGAVPGEYRVIVVPPQGPDQMMEEVQPVQATVIIEPQEGQTLVIEVEKVARSR